MTSATPGRRRAGANGGDARCTSGSSAPPPELIAHKRFETTTALEIADAADIAEKTFYNHFTTKQHLMEELACARPRTPQSASTVRATAAREHGRSVAPLLRAYGGRGAAGSREFTREVILELMRMLQVHGTAKQR